MMVQETRFRGNPHIVTTCVCTHLVVDEAPVAKGNQQVGGILHCDHGN